MIKKIEPVHGTGGRSTHELIKKVFLSKLGSAQYSPHDAASFELSSPGALITTDSHVVDPIIFPGGDIGKLAVCGVINDLLTQGGRPRFLSLGFVLEEGLRIEELNHCLESMSEEILRHEIKMLCADTKVIPAKGPRSGMIIHSTLIGEKMPMKSTLQGPQVGDEIVLTGPLAAHGLAVLQAREGLSFKNIFKSDCRSLYTLLRPALSTNEHIHYMRDPTRGGVASVLHELSDLYKVSFELDESALPVSFDVRAGLDLLGLCPLEVANEGVMVVIVGAQGRSELIKSLREHPDGISACVVGRVVESGPWALTMNTAVGGRRPVSWPEAMSLPRIC
jgi:hydrogenase expression/formation protein HypE